MQAQAAKDDRSVLPEAIARQIVSARAYGEWDSIHESLAWAREHQPLGLAAPEGYDPFWLVAKHADIQEVGRQPAIFNNNGYRVALISQAAERKALAVETETGAPQSVHSLVAMDPPMHGAYRMLTFGAFAPRGIKGLQDEIRALARESIAELAAMDGRCDFAKDIALNYPMRVILSLLGIGRQSERLMLRLTQEYFNPQDPELNQTGSVADDREAAPTAHETLQAYYTFFDELTEDRRRSPTDDVASKIANAVVDGALIDNWTATSYYITILTAGHDTTSSSTAGGVWALAERPALFQRVKADRGLIPALVEESIRWTTPLIHFMRTATQDYDLRGRTIRAGDWLMMNYVSANRDEDVIERPNEFLLDRERNPQIAFGHGAHVCLGQHLARMEMSIFFEEFFDRVASIELAGEPRRNASNFVGGVKTVPITFRMD